MNAIAAYRGLLGNRPLAKLLGGEFVSAIGDWLYIVALLVVIYGATGDPLVLGLFGAARVVPYILLSVPAGVLADRVDRRMILLVTDLARGVCMLAMAAVVAVDGPIALLVVLSILAACFSTFFYPAIGAYIPNLVRDERELGPANSAWASLDNLGFVLGPVLGGILLAAGGTVIAFLINALTFVIIAAVLWTLPPSKNVARNAAPEPGASPATSAGGASATEASATAVAATDAPEPGPSAPTPPVAAPPPSPATPGSLVPLAGVAILRFVDYAIYGGIGMLTVIYATDILNAGAAATGYLNAAIGVGGVLGAIASGLLVLRRDLTIPVVAGSAVIAAGAVLLGLAATLVVAFIAIALACLGHLVLEVLAATILQRLTSDTNRGRAVGSMVTVDTIAEASGSLVFPVLVVGVGALPSMAVAGALMLAVTVVGLALIGRAVTRPASPFEAVVARVARLPLFAGVPSAALEDALGRLQPIPVRAGDLVVRQGEPADRFYIIGSGRFVVRQAAPDGSERELRRLGEDQVFGELGLLNEAPRSASVAAETDGLVLALDGEVFLRMVGGRSPVRGRLLGLYDGVPVSDPAT